MRIKKLLELAQLARGAPEAPGAAAVPDQLNGRSAQAATFTSVYWKSSPLNSSGASIALASP